MNLVDAKSLVDAQLAKINKIIKQQGAKNIHHLLGLHQTARVILEIFGVPKGKCSTKHDESGVVVRYTNRVLHQRNIRGVTRIGIYVLDSGNFDLDLSFGSIWRGLDGTLKTVQSAIVDRVGEEYLDMVAFEFDESLKHTIATRESVSRLPMLVAKAHGIAEHLIDRNQVKDIRPAGYFFGEDGYIQYDHTRSSLRKYRHVVSWMAKAYSNAELSHAIDLKVGAVIVDVSGTRPNILSDGYNGTLPGADNRCEDHNGESLPDVIHAEPNAFDKLEEHSVNPVNCIMVVTRSPCEACVDLIIKKKIREVHFCEQHRLVNPLIRLQRANIKVVRIPKEHVIEHMTSIVNRLGKEKFNGE